MSHVDVRVDSDRCIGTGNCEFVAPSTFVVGDDGAARVLPSPADDPALVEQAIAGCPVRAISRVTPDSGGAV